MEDDDSESGYEGILVVDMPGPTRRRRMPVKDIMERIQKALPPIIANDKGKHVGDNYLYKPVGTVLDEYTHNSNEFVVCFAHGKDVIDYHHRVQRLALFFIENASDVDLTTDDGEHWKIFYLLRKHRIKKRLKYSLVGYLTLFYFSAPFRKPQPGVVARICQVLILPPYQRAGHGKRLLHCVHDLAQGKFDEFIISSNGDVDAEPNIVEINVEDPAPGFVALRNKVDFERLVQSKEEGQPWLLQLNRDPTRVSRTTFALLTDAQVNQASQLAKITPLQINICYEIYQLQVLREILQATSDDSQKEEWEKSYRLMVKKRLSKTHREEFGRGWGKKDIQIRLVELFNEVFQQYHVILGIPLH
jgi:histone acetyltransferase 1